MSLKVFLGLDLGQVQQVDRAQFVATSLFRNGSAIPFKLDMEDAAKAVPGCCVAVLELVIPECDVKENVINGKAEFITRDGMPGLTWRWNVDLRGCTSKIHPRAVPSIFECGHESAVLIIVLTLGFLLFGRIL